jgi:hypothetical protein
MSTTLEPTVCLHTQENAAFGEEGAFPTASTAAAQQALVQSRQRRDERALDKGAPWSHLAWMEDVDGSRYVSICGFA